jgi:hypothetical protein
VDAECQLIRGATAPADGVDDVRDPVGEHPAVGVAQGDDLGARLGGDADRLEGVGGVVPVAVEEVLGVEEDPPPFADEERDGVADHGEVLLRCRPQRLLDVPEVALGDQGHDRGERVEERADLRVVAGADAGPPRRSERCQRGVAQSQLGRRPGEELGVLRYRPGPSTLDEADAEVVEVPGDRELVLDGEREALLLGAVAQGGVVDLEGWGELGHRWLLSLGRDR